MQEWIHSGSDNQIGHSSLEENLFIFLSLRLNVNSMNLLTAKDLRRSKNTLNIWKQT